RSLGGERGELDLLFLLLAAIVAPAQYAVGADDRIAEEVGDDEQSERRHGRPPDDLQRILPHRPHDDVTESVKAPRIKLFAQLSPEKRRGAPCASRAEPTPSRSRPQPPARAKTLRPAYFACPPSSSSIRINWLYLARRSERARLPVLICPQLVATARSAMVASSVSPERCDMTAV